MSLMEECYRLLEVGPDASAEEIRGAYLALVNVWHPDRFAHDPALQARAMEKLKAINSAFEHIKNAPLRNGRYALPQAPFAAPAPRRPPPPRPAGPPPENRSAQEWFQQGLQLANPRVEMRGDESLTWTNIGDLNRHTEGIRAFQEAIRMQPDFADAWFNLGLAHAQYHQFIEAARAFRETVRLQPERVAAWINLGAALAQVQRYSEVIEAFREAVRLKADDASAWYTLGVAHAHPQIRQHEEARNAFREAVRLNPYLAEAWHDLGRMSLELRGDGDPTEALRAFREAVHLKPDLAEAWCSLGTTLSRVGRHDEAVGALRQALDLKPDLVEAWFALGVASRLGGRKGAGKQVEEAYTHLRRLDGKEAARFLRALPRHQRLWLSWRADR